MRPTQSSGFEIIQILDEQSFRLKLENLSNTRNIFTACIALATAGTILLRSDAVINSLDITSIAFLQMSVVCFLLSALGYSFYSKKYLEEGYEAYNNTMKGVQKAVLKIRELETDISEGKFSEEEFKVKAADIKKMVEPEEKNHRKQISVIIGQFSNNFFFGGMILTILTIAQTTFK